MHHRNPSVAIIHRQSTVAAVIRCIIEALQQHIRWVGLASTRPFGINRNCQKQGRSQLEKEAVGQVSVPIRGKYLPPSDTSLLLIPPIRGKYLFLSISCLSQASDWEAAPRQSVDLVASCNFVACSFFCLQHRRPSSSLRDIVPHISPSPKENVLQKRGLLLKPKTVKSIYPKQSILSTNRSRPKESWLK